MSTRSKVGDTYKPVIIPLTENGNPVDLTLATGVRVVGMRGNTRIIDNTSPTVDELAGIVTHQWSDSEVTVPGRVRFAVVVTWPGGRRITFPEVGWLAWDIGE